MRLTETAGRASTARAESSRFLNIDSTCQVYSQSEANDIVSRKMTWKLQSLLLLCTSRVTRCRPVLKYHVEKVRRFKYTEERRGESTPRRDA